MAFQLGYGEIFALVCYGVYVAIQFFTFNIVIMLLLGAMIAWTIYDIQVYRVWSDQGLDGPRPFPGLGNLLEMAKKGAHNVDMANRKKYGKFWGGYTMKLPEIVVCDLEIMRNVFVKDFNLFTNRRTFREKRRELRKDVSFLDKMISGSHDERWKRIRTLITPTFSSGKIKMMMPLVDEAVDTLVEVIQEKAEKGEFLDVKEHFGAFTLDVISSVYLGTRLDSQRNPDSLIVKYSKQLSNWTLAHPRLILAFLFPNVVNLLYDCYGIQMYFADGEKFFRNMLLRLIEDRRKAPRDPPDFLQLMLNSQKESADADDKGKAEHPHQKQPLSDDEIMAQMLNFLIGGMDATSSPLSFWAYSVAIYPNIQQRCYDEVTNLVREKGSLSYDNIQHGLPYLESVIMETLRIYPSSPRVDRVASEPYVINGIQIPAGTTVIIPAYTIHHSEEYFPEPEKFMPERFSPEERKTRDPLTYLPFGYGPRNCVGMRFAMVELKLCLARLVMKFQFEPCDKTEIPISLNSAGILKPKNPILLSVKLRE